MKKDYFSLSLGNVRHRGIRSWLTILGIFIGIAAVVSLISLGAGLKEAVTGQFSTLSADKLTIQNAGTGFGPPGSTAVEKLTDHDLDLIEDVSGVNIVVPRLIRVANVEFKDEAKFNYVADIPSDQEKADVVYDSFSIGTSQGRLLRAGERGKVILGKDIAEQFESELEVGDTLSIQKESFEIVGILEPASSFQINQVILMSTDDLKEILNIGDEIDLIVAEVSNQNEIESISKEIQNELRKDRDLDLGEEDFSVQTPLEALAAINTILNIINLIVVGIAAISLFVGGVGIMNTMYTSVIERTREIGIMKSIGAKNEDVLFIFLIESGLLGLIGGIIGSAIGLGLAYLISFGANSFMGTEIISVSFSPLLIFSAILFSFLVGIFSGILPAMQASKLNIVEAIRS